MADQPEDSPEAFKVFADCEEHGEAVVREMLKRSVFPGGNRKFVEIWLDRLDLKRAEAANKPQVEAAREANSIAREANSFAREANSFASDANALASKANEFADAANQIALKAKAQAITANVIAAIALIVAIIAIWISSGGQ